jgi:hypothetical protein
MASTYEPIATQTLGSTTATITFSSIPSTYTDLVLVANAKTTATGSGGTPQAMVMTYNSDTGTNYSITSLYASGSSAVSYRWSSQNSARVGAFTQTDATYFALTTINIFNYANTTTYKTSISRSGYDGTYGVEADVQLWRSTSAITSVTLGSDYSFKTGSTFTLYGIKAA